MRKTRAIVAVVLTILLAACVPTVTLYPLFGDDELVAEPMLEGSWGSDKDGDEQVLEIEARDKGTYRLVYTLDGETSWYSARLGRIGYDLFFDVSLDNNRTEELFKHEAFVPLVPVHFPVRVRMANDAMEIAFLDAEKMASALKSRDLSLAYHMMEDSPLITAETKELQRFVRDHATDEELWKVMGVFHRLPPEVAAFQRGKGFHQKERFAEAIEQYKSALALRPDYAEAWDWLGMARAGQERYDDAIAALEKAVQLQPHDAEFHTDLGHALLGKGNYARARDEFRAALRVQADSAAAQSYLAFSYFLERRFEEAVAGYERYIQMEQSPESEHFLCMILALRHLGRTMEAQRMLERAAKEGSGSHLMKQILEHEAGKNPLQEEQIDSYYERAKCLLHFYVGNTRLLEGAQGDAREQFKAAAQTTCVPSPIHLAARARLKEMEMP